MSPNEISALSAISAPSASSAISALRRCRQPVPARVAVDRSDRPVRVTSDRRGFAGGTVASCTGPWRTSGEWWPPPPLVQNSPRTTARPSEFSGTAAAGWNRDEWDVMLGDGTRYRIFRDRVSDAWFIDSIVD
jgi:hypothetical protein